MYAKKNKQTIINGNTQKERKKERKPHTQTHKMEYVLKSTNKQQTLFPNSALGAPIRPQKP